MYRIASARILQVLLCYVLTGTEGERRGNEVASGKGFFLAVAKINTSKEKYMKGESSYCVLQVAFQR